MRIAVVGAGLAGLSAAWLLGHRHEVTVFERHARPGFTASSVWLTVPGDGALRVDVPLRVFYAGYYPTLTRLYDALGVPSEPVSYAASFAGADGRLYFRYRNLRVGDASFGYLAPQDLLLGAGARRIAAALLRFHREAPAALASGTLAGRSIGDYVAAEGYPGDFVDGFLLPAIGIVCTCTIAQARAVPAAVIVDYLVRGLAHQAVRRALHGADDVERRLLAGLADLRCNARIAAVQRRDDGVVLRDDDGHELVYDHVVLATQANQTRRLLADARADEQAALDGFAYTPVEVVTHTDEALMPRRRRDWSPVNLWVSPVHEVAESTIWINAVQPPLRRARPVFQTVHPLRAPRDDRVVGRAHFERPVVGAASERALQGLQQLHEQPGRRVWFCGAYAQSGIPLLESAALSAELIARRFGAGLETVAEAAGDRPSAGRG